MKKALIITYYWPPSGGSGVQRWLKFAKYMPEFGWEPVIYTPENPDISTRDDSLEKECRQLPLQVIKRPIVEPYTFYKKFISGSGAGKGEDINPIKDSGNKDFRQRIALWARANLFIPDPKFGWIGPSVRFLKKYLKEHPVDVIISTGPPHSLHLIAKKLSRRLDIPWCADFRDPWTRIYYFKHLPMCAPVKALHRRMEHSVLTRASAVTTVSETICRELGTAAGTGAGKMKVHCVANGYDEEDFTVAACRNSDKKFIITYTGLLQASFNPDVLWKVLKQLTEEDTYYRENLLVRFVGKIEPEIRAGISAAGLSDYVEELGYLPHREIIPYQKGADFLLLPLSREPESAGILTGKFFEYLAAHHPIIAFGPKDSDLARLLKKTAAGRLFGWEEETALKAYLLGRPDFAPNEQEVRRFSRRALTARMTDILNEIKTRKNVQ